MYARSLTLNAGLSKKTHRPRGRLVTGGAVAAQDPWAIRVPPAAQNRQAAARTSRRKSNRESDSGARNRMNFMTLWMADAERTGNSVF